MTDECWTYQKSRLIDRFGERNFSREFNLLVAIECKSIPNGDFVDLVNRMIGSRAANRPPLLVDFREARLGIEKRNFDRDVYGAAKVMREPAMFRGLKAYLAKEFPGCKSLNDAKAVRAHQIQIQKAEDPSYDPLCDKAWMGEFAKEPWVRR